MRPDTGHPRTRRPRTPYRLRALGPLAAAVLLGATATVTAAPPAAAVTDGTPANQGRYPFMVSLRENGYPYCGGSLVAAQWVLTAAHCVEGRSTAILTAVVDQAARDGSAGESIGVDRVVVEPRYDAETEAYDVALVHLAAPTSGIGAVGIDPAGTGDTALARPGAPATVIGYGSTDPEDVNGNGAIAYPALLQQASVTIDTDSGCSAVFNGTQEPRASTGVMLCAGGDGRHDACVGDSGGPLLVSGGPAGWTQIGIVSWGAGCAVRGVPGVYVRLSEPQINAFVRTTLAS